jgi:hypothetical protein
VTTKVKPREATTLSPGLKRLTALPTASTCPAVSNPTIGWRGLVMPNLSRTSGPFHAGCAVGRRN